MITCTLRDKNITDQKASCYAFVLPESFTLGETLKNFAHTFYPALETYFSESKCTGSVSDVHMLPFIVEKELRYALFVGLGKKKNGVIDVENYRRALGTMVKSAISKKCTSIAFMLPPADLFGVTMQDIVKETVLIMNMAMYHFDTYITEESRKSTPIKEVFLCTDVQQDQKALMQSIHVGQSIAQGVNKTRYWIDLPPIDLTPPGLAEQAERIAQKCGLQCTIFDEKQINQMGMGGLAAVSRGSDLDCKLVILEYTPKDTYTKTVAFVGKGITFDSGGLSLKPANYMETMKDDMSGAAAVINTMEILAQLKPNVRVIGIAPLAENLPSGKATKPGDIVRFYNGKTAEIKNTDAEGRLILADALSYAVKHYSPDAIIDIATLTGACLYALGPFYTGLMSEHEELVHKITHSAQRTGDRVWQLPLHDDYKVAIKSSVADICNIGNQAYKAGVITAACFLQHFVDNVAWAHLDIAGTAFDVPDISYYRPGATGAGVRLLVDIAMQWK